MALQRMHPAVLSIRCWYIHAVRLLHVGSLYPGYNCVVLFLRRLPSMHIHSQFCCATSSFQDQTLFILTGFVLL